MTCATPSERSVLNPTVEVVCTGLVAAQKKPQAERCAWLDGPVAAGMVTPWRGQSCQGAPAAPGPFGLPWLCTLRGSAPVQVCARHSLSMTTKAVLSQPWPLWQQTLVHTCVHMLYPRAVPGAQLQSPVMGHCSAGEGLAQARADSAAVQRCSTLARREVQTVKRGDALTEGCRRSCCSAAGDAAASSGN